MRIVRAVIAFILVAACCRALSVSGTPYQIKARAPPTNFQASALPAPTKKKKVFTLSSTAFTHGGSIPEENSCWLHGYQSSGDGLSPPLSWQNVPTGTKYIAILAHNISTDMVHWFAIVNKRSPHFKKGFPLNIPRNDAASKKTLYQKANDYGVLGYSGPCPVGGERQTINFEAFALKGLARLPYPDQATKIRKAFKKKIHPQNGSPQRNVLHPWRGGRESCPDTNSH